MDPREISMIQAPTQFPWQQLPQARKLCAGELSQSIVAAVKCSNHLNIQDNIGSKVDIGLLHNSVQRSHFSRIAIFCIT